MSTLPDDRKYSSTHQWARLCPPDRIEIGITAYAQEALGDIVFADLPKLGTRLLAGEPFMVIESVKTASDVHAPVSGTVVEVNESLRDSPESLNADPYAAWLVRVTPALASGEFGSADLLDAASYAASTSPV